MLNYFEEIITRKKFEGYGNRTETQEIINSRGKKRNQFSQIDFQTGSLASDLHCTFFFSAKIWIDLGEVPILFYQANFIFLYFHSILSHRI